MPNSYLRDEISTRHGNLYNFKGQYRWWASRVAQVVSGDGDAIIQCIGDSTTRGSASVAGATQHANGYPEQLKKRLVRAGFASSSEVVIGCGTTALATTISTYDNRLAAPAGWTQFGSARSLGGYPMSGTGAGTLSFTPRTAFKKLRIYYRGEAGTGTATVNVDGGASLGTITRSTGTGVLFVDYAVTLATHVVNIVWASGTLSIYGIEAWDDTTTSIRVQNAGWHGATSDDIFDTANNGLGVYDPLNSIAQWGADLPIIMTGINDWQASYGVAAYKALLTNAAVAFNAANRPPLFISPVFTNNNVGEFSIADEYATAVKEVAVENNCAMLDMRAKLGSWAISNAAGQQSADNVHMVKSGYASLANGVYEAARLLAA